MKNYLVTINRGFVKVHYCLSEKSKKLAELKAKNVERAKPFFVSEELLATQRVKILTQ